MELTFPLHATFLALPLEDEAKREFQRLASVLEEYTEILTIQSTATPHLTLHYWKELMEIEYHQLLRQLASITERFQPFELKIAGIATFGSRGDDRVLFLSVPFSEDLARLKKVCNWPSLERGPGNIPVKPFHPHITLARIKHPQKFAVHKKKILKNIGEVLFNMRVDRLRLYSEIHGKKQTPIHEYALTGV